FAAGVDPSGPAACGGGYRSWWFADYTPPADPSAPIDQTVLHFATSGTDPVLNQFMGMLPFQAENPPRWQARAARVPTTATNPIPPSQFTGSAFVARAILGATRLRAPTIHPPARTPFGGARAVVKNLSSHNEAFKTSFPDDDSFGPGTASGTSTTNIDFFDFNGDGYPDVVGGGSIQATLPNGALGSQRISLANSQAQVRQNAVTNNNLDLGATTSNMRAGADAFPLNI